MAPTQARRGRPSSPSSPPRQCSPLPPATPGLSPRHIPHPGPDGALGEAAKGPGPALISARKTKKEGEGGWKGRRRNPEPHTTAILVGGGGHTTPFIYFFNTTHPACPGAVRRSATTRRRQGNPKPYGGLWGPRKAERGLGLASPVWRSRK
uniref:Uncharacterized protein n=1 Tax=Human herpesvirus 2 TaxID=10310 RepID=A0A481TY74_HHV2|nr:hypothetical protein [Human alphaherpesvirus 2]